MKYVFIFFTFLLLSCSQNSNDTNELNIFSKNEIGNIPLSKATKISMSNAAGGISINGIENSDSLSYTLNKILETNEASDVLLEVLKLIHSFSDSTLYTDLEYPIISTDMHITGIEYADVPSDMFCEIRMAEDSVRVTNLKNNITIKSRDSDIFIGNHSGSINIVQQRLGKIEIQAEIPDDGFCITENTIGNISLMIPLGTSANIFAETKEGIVSFENLTIDSLNQSANKVSGILGSGSGEIHLFTNSGNIEITGY